MIRFSLASVVILAALAGCDEPAGDRTRAPSDVVRSRDIRAAPANTGTASQSFGKGRGGEHKTMLHHH